MAKIKTKPNPGDVVVLTFVGYAKGALGVWSGTSWYMWRYTNAGATGEPNNWHVVEDNLIRAWAEIPAGVLATLGVPPTPVEQRAAPLRVVDTTEPWRPAMESYPAGRKYLRLVARAHAKLKRDASAVRKAVNKGEYGNPPGWYNPHAGQHR
jgi:hypothetical protein